MYVASFIIITHEHTTQNKHVARITLVTSVNPCLRAPLSLYISARDVRPRSCEAAKRGIIILRARYTRFAWSLQAAKPRSGGAVVSQREMYFKTDATLNIYKIHMILDKSNV